MSEQWTPGLATKNTISDLVEAMVNELPRLIGVDHIIPNCEVIHMDVTGAGNVLPRYIRVRIHRYYQDIMYRGGLALSVGDYVNVIHISEGERYEVHSIGGSSGSWTGGNTPAAPGPGYMLYSGYLGAWQYLPPSPEDYRILTFKNGHPQWLAFDWDNINDPVAADMVHDHESIPEGGLIALLDDGSAVVHLPGTGDVDITLGDHDGVDSVTIFDDLAVGQVSMDSDGNMLAETLTLNRFLDMNGNPIYLDVDMDTYMRAEFDDHIRFSVDGGNNRIRFSSGETIFNDAGNDVDFRVQTQGTAFKIFLAGNDHRVYILEEATPAPSELVLRAYGADGRISLQRYDGTLASPTATAINSELGQIFFWGFDGVTGNVGAAIEAITREAWNVGAHGTELDFWVTDIGSATNVRALQIEPDRDTKVFLGDTIGARGFYILDGAVVPTQVFSVNSIGHVRLARTGVAVNPLEMGLYTENLEIWDAGSVGATAQDWIQVKVGATVGYIHVFAGK